MAKGGKRPGAGRPVGSTTKPQFRDYFTEKERQEMVEMIKTHMVDDMQLLKFAAEMIFGKPSQAITGADGGAIEVQGVDIVVRK